MIVIGSRFVVCILLPSIIVKIWQEELAKLCRFFDGRIFLYTDASPGLPSCGSRNLKLELES